MTRLVQFLPVKAPTRDRAPSPAWIALRACSSWSLPVGTQDVLCAPDTETAAGDTDATGRPDIP